MTKLYHIGIYLYRSKVFHYSILHRLGFTFKFDKLVKKPGFIMNHHQIITALKAYKQIELHGEKKLRFFLDKHSTKEGTWGHLTVHESPIEFVFLDEYGNELLHHTLNSESPALVIPPASWHKIASTSDNFKATLQFLNSSSINSLLTQLQSLTARGGMHFLVFPIESEPYIYPESFTYLAKTNELYHFYQDSGWSILEYKEKPGQLYKQDESGKPKQGIFGLLLAQKYL